MEWVRGWLWAQGLNRDLVLVGYTLGASIALQYGLDYPDEVKGLVLMTVAAGPSHAHQAPTRCGCARQRTRRYTKSGLRLSALLLRGLDDPGNPPEYEKELHESLPGSRYVKLSGAGHFPPTEHPDRVNALIEEFVAAL